MKFCIQCNKELNGKQTKFCSKKCSNIETRIKNKNSIILSNKIFSENNSITIFPKHDLQTLKVVIINVLSQKDKEIIVWWQKKFNINREYLYKKVKCKINGLTSYRRVECLSISIYDIENIINLLEQRIIDTKLISLKKTIKTFNIFRLKIIKHLSIKQ